MGDVWFILYPSESRDSIKNFKTLLETKKHFDKTRRIQTSHTDSHQEFYIPTLLTRIEAEEAVTSDDFQSISVNIRVADMSDLDGDSLMLDTTVRLKKTPLQEAVTKWYSKHSFVLSGISVETLLKSLPSGHCIYKPMLLLPQNFGESEPWKLVLSQLESTSKASLWKEMASSQNITHVARIGYIPKSFGATILGADDNFNNIRAPIKLTPLYGNFGPILQTDKPTAQDLKDAFWVSTTQNGIRQTWAPRHTMFSRGNIKEKARILEIVKKTTKDDSAKFSVVDLYAGIGYFTFSYLKAGAALVLCWDINGWSIEGLRRGAEMNGWKCKVHQVFQENSPSCTIAREEEIPDRILDIVAFQANNNTAAQLLNKFRGSMPPIRHVNCGLLPTSRGSWETAVDAVDPIHGGWIHVHENFGVNEITEKAVEVCLKVQHALDFHSDNTRGASVRLEHVEKVKTYAPGVMHCVLDIFIPPKFKAKD